MTKITTVADIVVAKTRDYFRQQLGLEATELRQDVLDLTSLNLRDLTVLIGLGGPVALFVAFSLQQEVADALYQILTADIEVPAGEEALYRREAAADMVNVVLGQCTSQLYQPNQAVLLSPPLVLTAKPASSRHGAVFLSRHLTTARGGFDINLIGRRDWDGAPPA